MMLADYMYQERREKEDLTTLKTALTHSYNDSRKEKNERGLIRDTRNDTDNTVSNKMIITRKQKLDEKQLYGLFERLIKTSHTRIVECG